MSERLIEMTHGEFIDISQATATLRNALDGMPDETPARGQVVAANALILETLRMIMKRDGREL